MTSALDTRRNEQTKAKQREDAAIRDTVLRSLMSHPSGRRFIWLELSAANIFADAEPVLQDHALMAYFMGKRAMGLRLDRELAAYPNEYLEMFRENRGIAKEQSDGRDAEPDFFT